MHPTKKEYQLDHLEKTFDTASECLFTVDPDGYFLKTNPAFEKLLGYKKDELNGKLLPEIIHLSEDAQKFISQTKIHHLKHASESPLQIELTNKKGKPVPVLLHSILKKDDHGEVLEVLVIVNKLLKIQIEKILEQKVWETQETLHGVLANSGDAIFVANNEGCITIANEALLQMLCYQEEALIGKHIVELSPHEGIFTTTTGEELSITKEYFNYNLEKAKELEEKGKVTSFELYFIRKDKRLINIEATISLLKDQKGKRKGSIAICRDISERKKAEKEIKESHDFLENIFMTSVDGIIVTTPGGLITRANKAFEKLLDYSNDEIIGNHIAEFSPDLEDYYELGKDYVKRLFEKGFVSEESFTWQKKDGSFIYAEINAALLKDGKGNITGSVSSIRDVTSRKIKEIELIQIRTAIESASDAIAMADASGKLFYQNQSFLDLFGYTSEECSEIDIPSFYKNSEMLKNVVEKMKKGKIWQGEVQIRLKDGSYSPCSLRANPILDDNNNLLGFLGIHTDITELKQADRTSREKQKNLQSLFDTIDDFLFILDKEGHILSFNPLATKRLGYSKDELLTMNYIELHPPEQRDDAKAIFTHMVAGKISISTIPFITENGT